MISRAMTIIGLCVLNGAIALLLAPLFEGIMRKLRAFLHSRKGPPVLQPYLDLLKLLAKEDLRTARGLIYGASPALALGSVLFLAMLVPMGTSAPLSFAGDIIVVLYLATMSAILTMLVGFASGSPYAYVGSSREMMLLLSVEPVMAIGLVVGAVKAHTLTTAGIAHWQVVNGPCLSMGIAAVAFFLALQAQAGRLPFDVPEADQEIMGGTLVEQSGPRLAILRWTLWSKQLVLTVLFVELFIPWPRFGWIVFDLPLALMKVLVVLLVVEVVEIVSPRVRVDQAMAYYMRVGLVSLAALAFAVIGI